jgi:16S rRNA (cytidine1402-2'-O)-methyltransferase
MVSYYQHNSAYSGEKIISRILAGENCALVTDAGMPAISDRVRIYLSSAQALILRS